MLEELFYLWNVLGNFNEKYYNRNWYYFQLCDPVKPVIVYQFRGDANWFIFMCIKSVAAP